MNWHCRTVIFSGILKPMGPNNTLLSDIGSKTMTWNVIVHSDCFLLHAKFVWNNHTSVDTWNMLHSQHHKIQCCSFKQPIFLSKNLKSLLWEWPLRNACMELINRKVWGSTRPHLKSMGNEICSNIGISLWQVFRTSKCLNWNVRGKVSMDLNVSCSFAFFRKYQVNLTHNKIHVSMVCRVFNKLLASIEWPSSASSFEILGTLKLINNSIWTWYACKQCLLIIVTYEQILIKFGQANDRIKKNHFWALYERLKIVFKSNNYWPSKEARTTRLQKS